MFCRISNGRTDDVNVNVVWVSCTWTEQSTCQLKARLLVLHLIPVVQYITDNQPFDCTIFVWRS